MFLAHTTNFVLEHEICSGGSHHIRIDRHSRHTYVVLTSLYINFPLYQCSRLNIYM